jgi:hypothetical protein
MSLRPFPSTLVTRLSPTPLKLTSQYYGNSYDSDESDELFRDLYGEPSSEDASMPHSKHYGNSYDSEEEFFRDLYGESSSEDASISHSKHLLPFLEGRWNGLMRRAKILSGNLDYSHWTTDNVAGIGYQGIIDTGAYGDVFQVIPTSCSG